MGREEADETYASMEGMVLMIDLLNPLDGLVGELFHGPLHRIYFSRDGGFHGGDVEEILRRYGIRVWGRQVVGDNFGLLVKRRQAKWAEHVLLKAGVPIASALVDERNRKYANRPCTKMPKAWGKGIGPKSAIDHVVVWLGKLLG